MEKQFFITEIGATDWMYFQTTQKIFDERFWKDNPYKMMKQLGYLFNGADFSVGLHFDAYPPGFDDESNPAPQFWITVKKL